jgi:hypothetical protein
VLHNTRPAAAPPADPHSDLASILERLDEHEQVIEGMYQNGRLVTEQMASLALKVEGLAESVTRMREEAPALLMASAIAIVGNPEVWDAGRKAMASHARNAAGGWLLGWLGALVTRPLGIVALLLVLYQFGGLPAVWGWIKAHIGG